METESTPIPTNMILLHKEHKNWLRNGIRLGM